MASKTDMEDIESSAEFERIKQNFRSTVVAPDVTTNLTEYQTAFQNLQMELQSFLTDYMSKVKELQVMMCSDHNGVAHDHNTPGSSWAMTLVENTSSSDHVFVAGDRFGADRVSSTPYPPEDDSLSRSHARESLETVSHRTLSNQKSVRQGAVKVNKAPLDAHAQALLSFLQVHANNIRTLQASLQGSASSPAESKPLPNTVAFPHKPPATTADSKAEDKKFESLNQQFTMLVVISTFTAALIIAFLSLVREIVGLSKRTAYSVGMFFAFISLLIHFGNIIVAGRGANITSQHEKQYDLHYFNFLLVICEQLQFVALVFFMVAFAVMSFLMFSSVAFPVVLMILSIAASLIVFASAYWEVSLTLRNLKYLVKNLQRLKQSLEYLRIRAREDKDV